MRKAPRHAPWPCADPRSFLHVQRRDREIPGLAQHCDFLCLRRRDLSLRNAEAAHSPWCLHSPQACIRPAVRNGCFVRNLHVQNAADRHFQGPLDRGVWGVKSDVFCSPPALFQCAWGGRGRKFKSCHSDHDNGTAYKSVVPLFILPKILISQGFSAFFFINSSPKGASKKTHILIENALPALFFNRYRYPYRDIRWIYGYSLTLWGNRYLYPQIVILIGGNRWIVDICLFSPGILRLYRYLRRIIFFIKNGLFFFSFLWYLYEIKRRAQ